MSEINQAQINLWNGRVGEKWASMQMSLDAWVEYATAQLKTLAGSVAGKHVLDIGCGNGETCVLWLKGGATVTGVDVSEAMLAIAANRTQGKAKLICADASEWRGDTPYDLAISQFGLMFFADPDAAFTNIAANLRSGGRLLFCCWRSVKENPWVMTPMDAVRDLLPESAPSAPDAPGPFALADKDRLHDILQRAGFENISINPFDFPVCLASEGGVDAAVRFVMQIGPTSAALVEADKAAKIIAAERLKNILAPYEKNGRVALGGAVWMVEAVRAG
jgi:SAM-dependent methyltransferase